MQGARECVRANGPRLLAQFAQCARVSCVLRLPKILAMDQMVVSIMAAKRDAGGASSRPASAAGSGAAAVKASAAAARPAGGIDGLAALLESCNLLDKLADATAWCEDKGVDSVAMLCDDVDEEDRQAFAAALSIKELKAKQLLKRIAQCGAA